MLSSRITPGTVRTGSFSCTDSRQFYLVHAPRTGTVHTVLIIIPSIEGRNIVIMNSEVAKLWAGVNVKYFSPSDDGEQHEDSYSPRTCLSTNLV